MDDNSMPTATETCDTRLCPITASFDAAERVIGDYAELHEDPRANLGIIAINRRCAARVQETYPCPGRNRDSNGNIHCPLSGMIGDAWAMTAYRVAPTMIPPEKVVDGDTGKSMGQFL
jgi:hypothetical protein